MKIDGVKIDADAIVEKAERALWEDQWIADEVWRVTK